jgi:hypothetical protein
MLVRVLLRRLFVWFVALLRMGEFIKGKVGRILGYIL